MGRAPSRRDIVEKFIKRREYSAALTVAKEDSDDDMEHAVNAAAEPLVRELGMRLHILTERHSQEAINSYRESQLFEAALHRLDIDEAQEHLGLLELELEEAAAVRATGEENGGTCRRDDRLRSLLQLAGVDGTDDRSSLRDLEARWRDELALRSGERQHLITVETAFVGLSGGLPELASAEEAFREGNLRADRWLSEDVASNFAFLVQEAASKLASWAAAARMFRTGEREALSSLCGWFLAFVAERAHTIHSLESAEDVGIAMDRVLETADCIDKATLPTECLTRLVDIGETPAVLGDADETDAAGAMAPLPPVNGNSAPPAVTSASTSQEVLPLGVVAALRAERWDEAATICRHAAVGATTEASLRLLQVADAVEGLSNENPLADPAVADVLPSSAAWIANDTDAARLLPEVKRIELAYRALSGVIAADGNRPMPRRIGPHGS